MRGGHQGKDTTTVVQSYVESRPQNQINNMIKRKQVKSAIFSISIKPLWKLPYPKRMVFRS